MSTEEIRAFVLASLSEMNYDVTGVDDDTLLGPAAPTSSRSRSPSWASGSRSGSASGSTTTRPNCSAP
ncbi:hypothetical protein ACFQ0T_37365 [Kitasatospora gansuensis]